jgi:GGDEF domain-containing protein
MMAGYHGECPACPRTQPEEGRVVTKSASRALLVLLGTCAVLALGLGIFIGATGPGILRPLGALGAVSASFVVPQRPRYRWAAWVASLVACLVGSIAATGAELASYVGLLGALVVVGQHVARRARALEEVAEGQPAFSPAQRTFNDEVEREIARARRLGGPLTISTIAVPSAKRPAFRHHRDLAQIADKLKPNLRRTDAIGMSFRRRLILLFPGTTEEQAEATIHRLARELQLTEETTLRSGMASFPKSGVTWQQLLDVSCRRERPLSGQPDSNSERLEVG